MKKPSLRKSINDYCKGCTYDEYDKGTWRQQVAACTISYCPLHPVRPVGTKNKDTFLTKDLLKYWRIDPKELDDRARKIIK